MKIFQRGTAVAALCLLLGLSLHGLCEAQGQPENWFGHEYGQARVAAYWQGPDGERLLLDGLFMFKYPHDFYLGYPTTEGPVVISCHEDFMEILVSEELKYGYDQHWLFDYFRDYVFKLASYLLFPLEFSGTTTLARRTVDRYFDRDDPETVFWLDQQTGLPLLIREGERTLLCVIGYTLEPNNAPHYNLLELELRMGEQPAEITLIDIDGLWVPSILEVQDVAGEVRLEFSEWDFTFDFTARQAVNLKELRRLNERFMTEFSAQEWTPALATCQQMLALAPQYWNVYLFRAFIYEGLGDFLGVVENYQQVLMREPDNSLALNNLAYHYFLREIQIDQALQMAERAVELDRRGIYLDTLGYGYYLVGRYEEARLLLEDALLDAPEEGAEEIAEHLRLVLEALGEGE